jgi:hypothetical protein
MGIGVRLRLGCAWCAFLPRPAQPRSLCDGHLQGSGTTHNPKVAGSNPAPATIDGEGLADPAPASPHGGTTCSTEHLSESATVCVFGYHSRAMLSRAQEARAAIARPLDARSARLRQLVFAAPDIDAATFKDLAAALHEKVERVTLYIRGQGIRTGSPDRQCH